MCNSVKLLVLLFGLFGLAHNTRESRSNNQLEPAQLDQDVPRCLVGNKPDRKYFYHNKEQQNVTLLVNHKLETRLIGTVFEIFAKEKLGYDISIINVDNQDNIVIDTNLDTTFQKLSSCRNELLGWFIPSRTEKSFPPHNDHWKVFRDLETVKPFLVTHDQGQRWKWDVWLLGK